MFSEINLIAVLLAALANVAIGMAWYSPLLFMKPWVAAMGWTAKEFKEKQKSMNMTRIMSLAFLSGLLEAFVLAYFIVFTGALTILSGAMIGVWAWLGFVVVVYFTQYLYETNNLRLFLIGSGYQLVSLLVMGALIGGLS